MLAREIDALLAHVGAAESEGDANAARQMREWGVRTIDGDADPGFFYRDSSRVAPHNVVANTQTLRQRAADRGWSGPADLLPWQFRDGGGEGEPAGVSAWTISYGFATRIPAQPEYSAGWSYDPPSNTYQRSMAGVAHVDGRSGARLSATNVVVQLTPATIVDREGHVVYAQVGEGQAWLFRDGRVFEGTWTKRSAEDRTRYWLPTGEEAVFDRGATWVALVPTGSPFSWR